MSFLFFFFLVDRIPLIINSHPNVLNFIHSLGQSFLVAGDRFPVFFYAPSLSCLTLSPSSGAVAYVATGAANLVTTYYGVN